MLRNITFLLLTLSCSTANAQLQFTNPRDDLGTFRAGKRLTHRFWFTNCGAEDVHLLGVRGSCGCLHPRLRSQVLSPGDKSCIEMMINPFGQAAGKQRWHAFLRYRCREDVREKTLEVSANLITEVTIQPARLTLYVNGPVRKALSLLDLRDKPLKVMRVDSDSSLMRVSKVSPMTRKGDSWCSKLWIESVPSIPDGRQQINLSIYTNDPVYSNLQFPITLIKRNASTLQAIPSEVSMRTNTDQPFGSRLVRIRSRQNQPIKVQKAWADHRAVNCRWAQGPGRFVTLRISVDQEKMSEKKIRCEVHVQFDKPIDETLIIPLCCVVDRAGKKEK